MRLFVVALLTPILLAGCAAEETSPPNVLLIVVDTLRADALESYGSERATSPEIEARLAERGVVVERAYADAPWTVPSMASLLSGRPGSDLTNARGAPVGIPDAAQTLAELLAEAGYDTAAFVANATMQERNGFAQGFGHYQAPPLDRALAHHAGKLNDEVLAYLSATSGRARERPFFLWVHYLDPHDPYDNSDLVDGRSPFFPEYDGQLTGHDVHGLEVGRVEMEDPAEDLRHLRALYDSEVRFVDRHVGRLLDALGPRRLENTLLILTSDHGEEFHEHGGFKHGQTLYEEQLRVPWILRWDGVLPAGRRVDGPASLLDLLPTVASAVGLRPRDDLPGLDLLPLLRGDGAVAERQQDALERRRLVFRHLALGPERFAVLRGHRKEIHFDRHAPFEDSESLRADLLWQIDAERMQRREVYDLAADPGETAPAEEPAEEATGERTEDAPDPFCDLDPWLAGVRVMRPSAKGGDAEVDDQPTWNLRIHLDAEPASLEVRPLFLARDDTLAVNENGDAEGDELIVTLRLVPDEMTKGILLQGLDPDAAIEATATTVDGRSVPVPLPEAPEGDVTPRTLLTEECGLPGSGGVALWLRPRRSPFVEEVSPEQIEALEALGYL